MTLDPSGLSVTDGAISADHRSVRLVQMTTIAHGAALYLNSGIRPNRMYTPTRMRDALNACTGSSARNLKAALKAYVEFAAECGVPVTSPSVLRAVAP